MSWSSSCVYVSGNWKLQNDLHRSSVPLVAIGWSRWPTGKNTTSQFMRVLLKSYQGPPRKGASSTKIWMVLHSVKTTYLPQNSWEFKGTMPNKALLRPYFLGKGVGIAGVTLSLKCSSTKPVTENWKTQGSIDCIGGVSTFLRDKKVKCHHVSRWHTATSLQDSTRRLHF